MKIQTKMRAHLTTLVVAIAFLTAFPATAYAATPSIGVVDFQACLEKSKFGQEEQNALLTLQKQMAASAEELQNERTSVIEKLNDPEYIDSLSPEAEQELMVRYQTLEQNLAQKQQQFYQVINQQQMKVLESLSTHAMRASQIVSREMDLEFVIRKDACFFFTPKAEITDRVITEMDKLYAVEHGENADEDRSV